MPCKLHIYVDDLDDIMKNQFLGRDVDTVMILDEVYSTPKMNLYWGLDYFKRQYYFYKTPNDSLPIQLFIDYKTNGGGQRFPELNYDVGRLTGTQLVVQKGFVNQLRFIMGDCKKISEAEWDLLSYKVYSLKALIKQFNKCK